MNTLFEIASAVKTPLALAGTSRIHSICTRYCYSCGKYSDVPRLDSKNCYTCNISSNVNKPLGVHKILFCSSADFSGVNEAGRLRKLLLNKNELGSRERSRVSFLRSRRNGSILQ